ncbi:MAG: endo alpha-1,4 polygalactosaminidase [Alphaproteobacteria bacterium]|nr:endo alpha-1,4 polygalactosaminidase [Alphaproteobacteria bacterium]
MVSARADRAEPRRLRITTKTKTVAGIAVLPRTKPRIFAHIPLYMLGGREGDSMDSVRRTAWLWACLALGVGTFGANAQPAPMPWAVYYAAALPPSAFYGYDLVVFEPERHPPIEPLIDRGKKVIGYLSLGEVNEGRAYFAEVKAEGLLRQENQNWKGSYFVDVRDLRWTKRAVEDLVPDILSTPE